MEVKMNRDGNNVAISIIGRLDTTSAPDFQAAIAPLMEESKLDISIDCSQMEYTSSLGLRSFLLLQKNAGAKGGSLTLSGMQPQVKEVFDITGFSSIIKII